MDTLTPAQQKHLIEAIMALGFTHGDALAAAVGRRGLSARVTLVTTDDRAQACIRLDRPGEVESWHLSLGNAHSSVEHLAEAMADMGTLLVAARACWQLAADLAD